MRSFSRILSASVMAFVCLTSPPPVFAQGDVFSTNGRGGNIVSDAHWWWSGPGHTDAFRTRSTACLPLLDEAEGHRQTSMRYREASRARGLSSAERSRLHRLAGEEYTIVSRLVRGFIDCAGRANRVTARSAEPQAPPRQRPQTPQSPQQPGRSDRPASDPDQRPRPAPPQPQGPGPRPDRIDTGDDEPARPAPLRPSPQQPQPRRRDRIDTDEPGRRPPVPQPPQQEPPRQPQPDRVNPQPDCLPLPSPRIQLTLRNEGNEALRTLAACGAQCDIFETTLGRLAAARLIHLTQPGDGLLAGASRTVPALIAQASAAAVRYLTNDNAANHRMLLEQAQAAVGQADRALKLATRNPAASLAYVADGVLWMRVGTASRVGACEVTAIRGEALVREVDEARRAVEVAKATQARARARSPVGTGAGAGGRTRVP